METNEKLTKQERKIYKDIVVNNNLMALEKNIALNKMAIYDNSTPSFYCGVVFKDLKQIEEFESQYNPIVWKVARQLNHNRQRNKKRLKVKIDYKYNFD